MKVGSCCPWTLCPSSKPSASPRAGEAVRHAASAGRCRMASGGGRVDYLLIRHRHIHTGQTMTTDELRVWATGSSCPSSAATTPRTAGGARSCGTPASWRRTSSCSTGCESRCQAHRSDPPLKYMNLAFKARASAAAEVTERCVCVWCRWPSWRTRLYLDNSVPLPFIRYLREDLNVEVSMAGQGPSAMCVCVAT